MNHLANPTVTPFQLALAAFAIAASFFVVTYAFALSPDGMERAKIVVQGCEQIVCALAALLALRASCLIGRKNTRFQVKAGPASMRVPNAECLDVWAATYLTGAMGG